MYHSISPFFLPFISNSVSLFVYSCLVLSTQRGSVESTTVVGATVATESVNTTTIIIITTTTNRPTRPPPLVLDTTGIGRTIGPTIARLPSAVYSSPLRSRDSSVFRDCPIWRVCEGYASCFCFPSPPLLNKISKPTWIAFKKDICPPGC